MTEIILTNARLVFDEDVRPGSIVIKDGIIAAISTGPTRAAGAVDVEGDVVAPGLIEMHTDNAEKHFEPRPGVLWPDGLSAILAHEAQMAAAGVTTVYDSVCVGYERNQRRMLSGLTLDAISRADAAGLFRIDHRIHLRCELAGEHLIDDLKPHADNRLVHLASLMDHTPGQRQWRNLEDLRRYNLKAGRKPADEQEREIERQIIEGPQNRERNLPPVLEILREHKIPIATHDDTTVEDAALGAEIGAVISEFPTTREAAAAAHRHGLKTIAGAPNVVRGGSHSGGVNAAELARDGLLDGLSSDYVPSSLLQAVLKLTGGRDAALPEAMALVTRNVADMLGLSDRGRLAEGLRADLVRFRAYSDTPIVRGVWSRGERAF